ncbi:tetratricopeptide repeat protein [Clostridium aestuarii]|uniref:Tetratricopeptide repeat protein n=1 Tax=Clostridium aestuarii TaxID=338193 RepID=A0ABT4D6U3_9CLOT|nr:tetratricopeptide repeat protein [Clostridium aestuarii]MCY6485900.1 tetratricopeptide repeat protein [Clostridium aestuarii]
MENENVQVLIQKGIAYIKQQQFKEAIECYDKILQIDPDNIDALFGKALSYKSQYQYKEAIEYYNKALAIEPNNIYGLLSKINCYISQYQYKEAIEYYNKALEIAPNNIDALLGKGICYRLQQQYKQAMECYDKVLHIAPNNIEALLGKGSCYISQYDKAIKYYNKALDIDPNNINALVGKGYCYISQYQYKEAIEYYNKALDIDSNNISVLLGKALCYRLQEQFKEAIECYDKVLHIDSKNIEALLNKGICYRSQYRYKEEMECYDKALHIDSKNIEALLSKAICYILQRKYIEAIRYYNKVLDIDSNNINGLWGKGTCYKLQEHCEKEAIEYFNKVIEYKQERAYNKQIIINAYTEIAKIFYKNKESSHQKEAEKYYWEIIKEFNEYIDEISPIVYKFFKEEEKQEEEEKEEGKPIYHYTSIFGLEGILKNKCFQISKSDFLNDKSDTSYLVEKLHKIKTPKEDTETINLCTEIYKYIDENSDENSNKQIFILSSTTEPDYLPLWSNYAKGDGYNIGFNKEKMINNFGKLKLEKENIKDCLYKKIIYGITEEKLLDLIKYMKKTGKENKVEDRKIIRGIAQSINTISLFIKHPAFECEKEFRIAILVDDSTAINDSKKYNYKESIKIDCRINRYNMLIPFIEIPLNFNSGLVEEINIGPINRDAIAKKGVEYFLKLNNIQLDSEKIKTSQIPLRFL